MGKKNKLTSSMLDNAVGFDDMCEISEEMGYKRGFGDQLACPNGAYVSSFMDMMEDNPGMVEAMCEWIRDNFDDVLEKNDEENEAALEEKEEQSIEKDKG